VQRLPLEPGERVLIVGVASGVGAFAVQLASLRGVEVVAVARRKHHSVLRELGTAQLIDYAESEALSEAAVVTAATDLVGHVTMNKAVELLAPFGRGATPCSLEGDSIS